MSDDYPRVLAIHSYTARNDKELSFAMGDEIAVHEIMSEQWWIGEVRGDTGFVPAAYLEHKPIDEGMVLPTPSVGSPEYKPAPLQTKKEFLGSRPDLGKAIQMHHVKTKHDVVGGNANKGKNEFKRHFSQMKQNKERSAASPQSEFEKALARRSMATDMSITEEKRQQGMSELDRKFQNRTEFSSR